MSESLTFDPKQLRILVVDTHDLIRKTIAKVLNKMGVGDVIECLNGKDAKVILSNERIDLVICDLDLGNVTGFELLDLVRNLETGSDLPFIIVTGDADKDDIVKAVDKGADDYMLKPFQNEDLEKKVIKVMSAYLSPGPLLAAIRAAEKLLQAKDWDKACTTIDAVIAKKPDSSRATHLKAIIAAKSGNTDEAIEILKKNIAQKPNYLKNHASLADLFFQRQDFPQAIAAMTRELELNPKHLHRQIRLANMLLRDGNFREAIAHYRLALLENAKSSEALYGMGMAYSLAGKLEKAIYYFKRMRRHHPKQPKPLQAIVKQCINHDNPHLAEMSLRDEKKNHPERTDTYILLADFYLERENDEAAAATLLESIKKNPNFTDGYMKLANFYANRDEFDEVSALFDRYYKASKDPNAFIREADVFLRTAKYARAMAALHKGMKPEANLAMIMRLLLLTCLKTKQYGKAYFVLQSLLAQKTPSSHTTEQYSKDIKAQLRARRRKKVSTTQKPVSSTKAS